jgi:hypothetical protein
MTTARCPECDREFTSPASQGWRHDGALQLLQEHLYRVHRWDLDDVYATLMDFIYADEVVWPDERFTLTESAAEEAGVAVCPEAIALS